MKSLPNIAAACFGIFAGCLLTLASWERPETIATPAQPTIAIPEATVIAPITPPGEQPAPQPVVEEAAKLPLPPVLVASYGDCANGACSAPRAASVRRYQPVRSQRSGLLSRLRIRR